jgi:hypothetical protein
VTDRLRWDESLRRPRESRLAWFRREPSRAVLLVSLLVAALGTFAPWTEYFDRLQGRYVDAFGGSGAGDGAILLVVLIPVAGIMLRKGTFPSTYRTVQWLPSIFIALAAVSWLNGWQSIVRHDGPVKYGVWVACVGVALSVASVAWLSATRRRIVISPDPPELDERGIVLSGIGALAGCLVGFVSVMALAGSGLDGMTEVAIVVGAYALAVAGAVAGSRLARRVLIN